MCWCCNKSILALLWALGLIWLLCTSSFFLFFFCSIIALNKVSKCHIYDILCHYGDFSCDTCDKFYKYCHPNLLLVHQNANHWNIVLYILHPWLKSSHGWLKFGWNPLRKWQFSQHCKSRMPTFILNFPLGEWQILLGLHLALVTLLGRWGGGGPWFGGFGGCPFGGLFVLFFLRGGVSRPRGPASPRCGRVFSFFF